MLTLSRRTVLAGTAVGALALALPLAIHAQAAGGVPANKAVAAASKTEVMAPGENATLLTATFKTSKPEDLLIGVSAECSILTNTVITGTQTPAGRTASAGGRVRVWVELDGVQVPILSSSTPPQDPAAQPAGNETDKVTFCDQVHTRTVTDNENDNDGTDGSTDYLLTKSSAGFNWVRLNAGSDIHTLKVKADLILDPATEGSSAQAVVGNRTLIIEPTKFANGAVVADIGSSNSGG